MNISEQLCSLELSIKLKELGINSKSYFAYFKIISALYYDEWEVYVQTKSKIGLPAYTAQELFDLLPTDICVNDENQNSIHYQLNVIKCLGGYVVEYYSSEDDSTENWQEENDTLPNCLAKMLIKVTEQGFLKLGGWQ